MNVRVRRVIASAFVLVACGVSVAAQPSRPLEPRRADLFDAVPLKRLESVSRYLPAAALQKIRSLVDEHRCPSDDVTLFRKRGSRLMVLTVPCWPTLIKDQNDPRYYAFLEYPLTLEITRGRIAEVPMSQRGFMYQSGSMRGVTDIDGNGMPEFWLSGAICECDGEPQDYGPEGCQCDGTAVVEYRNGKLIDWQARKRGKSVPKTRRDDQ